MAAQLKFLNTGVVPKSSDNNSAQSSIMLFAIKTFANQDVGAGHIFRQWQIAKELKRRGHKIQFILNKSPESLKIARELKLNALYERNILGYINSQKIDGAIIDQLATNKETIEGLKSKGTKTVTFDDRGSGIWYCDMCVCSLYEPRSARPKWSKTKLLSGFRYLLLGDDFQNNKIKKKFISKEVKRILITQGGTDTYGLTPYLVRSLSQITNIKIDVLTGLAFAHADELKNAIATSSGNFLVHKNYDEFIKILNNCDLAISAGGLTLFEILCWGIPTIAITAEPREKEILTKLPKGAIINFGYVGDKNRNSKTSSKIIWQVLSLISNHKLRKKLSLQSQKKFKGSGVKIVCDEIVKLTSRQ